MAARKLILLLLLLVALVPAAVVQAQQIDDFEASQATALPISYGETVSGELTAETPSQLYAFEAAADDVVTISLFSPGDEVDTYLNLLDGAGNEIAANDDGDAGRNSLIEAFTIPADGTYYAVANSFGNAVADEPRFGAYELMLTLVDDGAAETTETPEDTTSDPLTDALPISYGETVSGELTDATPQQAYAFEAAADDVITITLISPDDEVDTYLNLLDGDGNEIAANDDSGDGRNSQITDFVIPADGTYYAIANSFGNATAGEPRFGAYELTLTVAEATEDETEEPTEEPEVAQPDPIAIAYGETVQGELTGTPQTYTFSAQAADLVTITLTSTAFDPLLTLLNAEGTTVFSQTATDGSAQITDFFLLNGGDFQIEVASSDEANAGIYNLILAADGVDLPLVEDEDMGTIPDTAAVVDISEAGELTEDEPTATVTFDANAGDTVTISLTGDFDTFLTLLDINGDVLETDDDGGEETNSFIETTLPDAGTYSVVVDSFTNAREGTPTAGAYNLTITTVAAPIVQFVPPTIEPIAVGDTVTGDVTLSTPLALFSVEATASQTVTIDLTSDDFDTILFVRDAIGTEIASDDDGGVGQNALIEGLAFPEDGEYIIVVDSYDNAVEDAPVAGAYTLTITDAEATAPALVEGEVPVIAYGDSVESEFTDEIVSEQYAFSAQAGDVVTVRMEGDFDTFLFLLDATGEELINNDDTDEVNISVIDGFVIPADGTYLIQADSYGNVRLNDPRTGSYTLTLTLDGADPVVTEPDDPDEATEPDDTDEVVAGPDLDSATTGAPIAIGYGDSVEGEFTETVANQQYVFTASAGDVITVDLTAGFDTFLFLLDADGNQLVADDDGGEGRNSRITDYVIPADGDYIILADSYGNARLNTPYLGEYTVTLTAGDAVVVEPDEPDEPDDTQDPPPITTGEPIDIAYGDSVTGELSADVPNQPYVFSAAAGDTIQVDLTSDDFDTYLQLLDANGDVVLVDDDGGEGRNSRITFEIPADGDYTILADSYGNALLGEVRDGDYTLTLVVADAVVTEPDDADEPDATDEPDDTDEQPAPTGDVLDIAVGDTVDGTLTVDVPAQQYRLDGAAGDVITITLVSEDFDAFLRLLDADGEELTFDDDSGGARNARIGEFELLASGTYLIEATSYDLARLGQAVSGAYTLTVAEATSAITTDIDAEPIAYRDTVMGELTLDIPFSRYVFSAAAGDVVTIDLSSDDFDTFLRLLDADGVELITNDDGGEDLGSRIQAFEIPADGDYLIEATSFGFSQLDDPRAGAFTLTLAAGDAVVVEPDDPDEPDDTDEQPDDTTDVIAIEIGDTVSGELTEDTPELRYSFDVTDGDVLDITVSSDFDTYMVMLGENGDVINEDDDSGDGLNAAFLAQPFDRDETVELVVTSFGHATGGVARFGEFELTVEFSEDAPVVVEPSADVDLEYGDFVEDQLTVNEPEIAYTFFGQAGDAVAITLSSIDFDPYLLLLDENGDEIAFDDDGAGELNSRIGPFVLPEAGEYTIIASSFGWINGGEAGTGFFVLSLEEVIIEAVEYGDTVAGFIEPTQSSYAYTFEGEDGDLIFVDLEATDFDVYMVLAAPDGDTLVQTFGDYSDLGPIELTDDGEYVLTITSFDPSFEADFIATISSLESRTIRYNTPLEDELVGEPNIYTFEGIAGDTLEILVDSGDTIDTLMTLTDPDGFVIAEDDDGGEGFDPELFNIVLPMSGEYTLTVRPFIGGENGEYTLSVNTLTLPSLIDGPQTIRLSSKQPQAVVTFEGEAGQTVLLSAEVLGGLAAQPLITVTQFDDELASNGIGNVERVIIQFTVPEDGVVRVTLEDFAGASPLALELDIVELAGED